MKSKIDTSNRSRINNGEPEMTARNYKRLQKKMLKKGKKEQ